MLPLPPLTEEHALKLLELVREMREAQKQYFKTRSKKSLLKARELEHKVDRGLELGSPGWNP